MDNQKFEEIKKKLRLTNRKVADTLGVDLWTVKRWAEGVWEIPFWAEKFLYVLLEMKRNNEVGFSSWDAAYKKGFDEGLKEVGDATVAGYTYGYSAGYSAAKEGREYDN